jgi:hypothetical protein
MRRQALISVLLLLAWVDSVRSQAITSTWTGVSGSWTNPTLWSTNPFFPNAGNPLGTTYNAIMNGAGSLTVTQNISLVQFTLQSGALNVQNGTFSVDVANISGSASIGDGAVIRCSPGSQLNAGGTLSGPGTLQLSGSTTINGLCNIGSILNTGSNLTLNSNTTTGSLTLGGSSTATISNPNALLTVDGPMSVASCTLLGPIVVGGPATIAATSGTVGMRAGSSITFGNGVNWSIGTITMTSAQINNNLGSIWLASGDDAVIQTTSTGGTINNSGVFRKQGGTGTTTMTNLISLVNTGSVEVLTGALACNPAGTATGGLTNFGSVTVGSGARLGGVVKSQGGGIVQGTGTLGISGAANTFDFLAGSTLAPGLNGPGTLDSLALLSLHSGAQFVVDLNGNQPGTEFDQLRLGTTGAVNLNGATLVPVLGFEPALGSGGDALTILFGDGANTQVFGTFAGEPDGSIVYVGTFNGQNFGAQISYSANSVVLDDFQLVTVPEPTSFALTGLTALAGFRLIRRRVTLRAA